MIAVGPDFALWAISLLFGAFCVWNACRITKDLGVSASKQAAEANNASALDLHIGHWVQIATTSPAVAFFTLGVCSGLVLPALYSWWYSPMGPKGTQIITARGQFHPSVGNVCFQTDQVVSYASGYALKIPRQVQSISYTIETPNMAAASLFIELDGSGAWYSIDNQRLRLATIDHSGVLAIDDPIPFENSQNASPLPNRPLVGRQTQQLVPLLGPP
jgi:hypothetical protein